MHSAGRIAQYECDGFLVLPDFVRPDACTDPRAVEIVDVWSTAAAERPACNWLRRPEEMPLRRLDTVAA